jgi:acetylglutamate kinase
MTGCTIKAPTSDDEFILAHYKKDMTARAIAAALGTERISVIARYQCLMGKKKQINRDAKISKSKEELEEELKSGPRFKPTLPKLTFLRDL